MVEVEAPFYLNEQHTEDTLSLLKKVTLGSNGARYRHIGIPERINSLYRPLFLNLSLRDQLIANVTFCRRKNDWYVRYFAFDSVFQASSSATQSNRKGKLKTLLNNFFKNALRDPEGPATFYAYIDPKNERSLWMSESFGFKTVAQIATQTFSRIKPHQTNVHTVSDKIKIENWMNKHFGNRPFYHPFQTYNATPFYALKKNNEVVAFAKVHYAQWRIEQLPGKNGELLTKIVPYIPLINRLIKPKKHQFLVIDSVWAKDYNKDFTTELFEGILYKEKHNVLHWWVDHKEPLYQSIKTKVKWGLINKINGVHDVNLVVRSDEEKKLDGPVYVSGFDFI